MKWIVDVLNKIWNWFCCKPAFYTAIKVEDLPEQLHPRTIYVAGENDHLWYAAMICPCGCGEVLQMGLMHNQRPRWTITEHDDGAVSLYPSVWRKVGCKSHFWLQQGNIFWCYAENDKV